MMPTEPLDRTVDPAEVQRYRALADLWWQTDGRLWPLHTLNRLRSRYIIETVCAALDRDPDAGRPLDGLQLLDVGCGGGLLSEAMAAAGARVHGIDVVDKSLVVARGHARESGLEIDYELTTAADLQARGTHFDVVLNMEVVEHVADLPAFMAAVNALVAPGGLQFVATINRTLLSFLVAILGAEYVLRLLPRGTHQWRRFPTPAELEALLVVDGFRLQARTGVKVNPFRRRMWLTPSLQVNYMLVAGRSAVADDPVGQTVDPGHHPRAAAL